MSNYRWGNAGFDFLDLDNDGYTDVSYGSGDLLYVDKKINFIKYISDIYNEYVVIKDMI